jgi:tetratricopeptide (TPR) repeat protein
MSLAKAANDAEVERRALRSFGFLRWRQDRSDEALAINETLLGLHTECGDDRAVVGDLVNLCVIKRDRGDFDGALAYLEQAEDVLERFDNPSVESYLAHSLGTIYQLRGEDEEALPYFEHARSLAEKHRLPLQLSFNMMSVAHINLKLGRVERSIEYYKKAIELTRRSRYADGLAKSLLIFGDVLYGLARYDEALEYLEEAADWLGRIEDATSEAEALKKIAAIYERNNRIADAEKTWHRLTDRLDALDVEYEIDALEAFAGLARRRGDHVEALAHHQDAIELSARAGDPAREARLRNSAGILEWQRGHHDEALLHYEKAHDLFMQLDDPGGIGLMQNSIGLTLHKLGRDDDALRRLQNALETHRAAGHPQLEAHALAVIGDIEAGQGHFESALESYAASLQLRWDENDRLGEGWMLHHMAAVHAARGEDERAGEYLRQALVIAAELGSERLLGACDEVRKDAGTNAE